MRGALLLFVIATLRSAVAAEATGIIIDPVRIPVGGISVVRVAHAPVTGTFGTVPLRFFRRGDESVALVGVDVDHRPGRVPVRVTLPDGRILAREVHVVRRRFPVERLTVPKAYTELDPKTLERVERERRRLETLWAASDGSRYWEGPFVVPADGPAGSPFGLRRFFNGEPRSPHAGIDFKAPAGTPVRASNRGRVVLADDLFFTGKTVVLDHGLGLFTLYVHLSAFAVEPGQLVATGEEIGRVGATGRATGPHLHFGTRLGEARVDPALLLGRTMD